MSSGAVSQDLTQRLVKFLNNYYRNEVGKLAQHYPNEQQSLLVRYNDLFQFDREIAEDYLDKPDQLGEYLDEALHNFDLPADIDLRGGKDDPAATVRVVGLPDQHTHYPGHFSPTDVAGQEVAIEGEVVLTSEVRPRVTDAAFECQRCGTMSYIPQEGSGFQEPHECDGCERQGPFQVNHDQSEFIDSQRVRVQEPPSVAGGSGSDITVELEGEEMTDVLEVGDELKVPGTVHLQQRTNGQEKTAEFDVYLDGHAIELSDSDQRELDIDSEERAEIQDLAGGEEGDPLDLAAASLAPKIFGHDHIKRALILAMVGGHRVVGGSATADRGNFHVLKLGDPGTAKSKLGEAAAAVAPRSVSISGKNASQVGITATAVRDETNDGEWTLKPGAFVKANKGMVWLDEIDDMDAEIRTSMLEPMSNQKINVSKAGINANLSTECAVIAAGNPKYGRFDPYEPIADQFEFDSPLLSRFDLIFTVSDQPDPDKDEQILDHMSMNRELRKRLEVAPETISDEEKEQVEAPVEPELLRKWIALAKQQPAPITADREVRKRYQREFHEIRAANGYEDDSTVPITFRAWEAVLRIAEAAAKFELSKTIEKRHFETSMSLVRRSMEDYGVNEEGEFDADVVENGGSMSQKKRMETITETVREMQPDSGGVPLGRILDELEEEGINRRTAKDEITDRKSQLRKKGHIYSPTEGTYRAT